MFTGHYVVACGFDKKKKRIFYKNPSYDEGTFVLLWTWLDNVNCIPFSHLLVPANRRFKSFFL